MGLRRAPLLGLIAEASAAAPSARVDPEPLQAPHADRRSPPPMSALSHGGPTLPQERRLVTEIPGPLSRELFERRNAVVANGVSTTLPIFVTQSGGGVVVDVDGNSLIDFGSGIAVTSVGNSA